MPKLTNVPWEIRLMHNGRSIASSFQEAAACAWLGLRSALSIGALLTSLLMWFAVAAIWLVVFLFYRESITELALKAAVIAVFGVAALIPGALGSSSTGVVGGGIGMAAAVISSIALSWVVVVLLYVALVVLSVRVLVELMLMPRIRSQTVKRYPILCEAVPAAEPSGLQASLRNAVGPWFGLVAGSIACLLLPFVGGLALFVLLSYFNVRFLVNDAMEDLASPKEIQRFAHENRPEMIVLGLLLTLLSLVPFVGLLAPWFTGSSVCHLAMRHLSATRMDPDASHSPAPSTHRVFPST